MGNVVIDHPVQIVVTSGCALWCERGKHYVRNVKFYKGLNTDLICEDHVRWIWWPSGEEAIPARKPPVQSRR